MLERAGLTVTAETAILFIPGELRMLDLACHSWCRPLSVVTARWCRRSSGSIGTLPWVRSHGYLLATVAVKPRPSSG